MEKLEEGELREMYGILFKNDPFPENVATVHAKITTHCKSSDAYKEFRKILESPYASSKVATILREVLHLFETRS